jgi:hypothetical protein
LKLSLRLASEWQWTRPLYRSALRLGCPWVGRLYPSALELPWEEMLYPLAWELQLDRWYRSVSGLPWVALWYL